VRTTLDIDLTIHVKETSDIQRSLSKIGKFAAEIFIVSNFSVKSENIVNSKNETDYTLELVISSVEKCPRCWKKIDMNQNLFCDKTLCGKNP